MTHEKHFLSLSYTSSFPCQPALVRGSIVKRCVYFGLCSPFCHYLTPHCTQTGDFAVEIQPLLQITFVTEKKNLHPAPPISFGEEAKCYFAEFHWQFLVRAPPAPPCTFLAKCCKINGGPLNFNELRWSGQQRKQAHASEKRGNRQSAGLCCLLSQMATLLAGLA